MSSWGKLLVCDVVVPATWSFAWHEGATHRSVDVAAATYDTVLHVAAALQTALRALGGGHTSDSVAISEVGKTTITVSGMTAHRWDATTDALATMLGFDETEAVASSAIVSSAGHTHGWYPGAVTHNYNVNRGAGLVSGARWIPTGTIVRQWAGSGKQRTVKTNTRRMVRPVRFDIVDLAEVQDWGRGVAGIEPYLDHDWRWYPDRALGLVAAYGTQGDPWSNDDTDATGAHYWWKCSIADDVDVQEASPSRTKFSVDLVLNGRGTT